MIGRSLGLLALSVLGAARGLAQTPLAAATPVEARLGVRLQQLQGTDQTKQAGEVALDSLPGYRLYVPPACVGRRRCPLLVVVADLFLHNAPGWSRSMASRYGMVVLEADYYLIRPLGPYPPWEGEWYKDLPPATPGLAAALTQVLRRVAVDPDHIALYGNVGSRTAGNAWYWAMQNPDVFSRVVLNVMGDAALADSSAPRRAPAQPPVLLLTARLGGEAASPFRLARQLRQRGYSVPLFLSVNNPMPSTSLWEEYDFIGRWLRDSWAKPAAAARPAAVRTSPDSLPLLTKDAVARLATFWASFQQEPDSIRRLGRRRYLRELHVPVGPEAEQPVTALTDMAALAARYPSVAGKLRAAGLTAEQHDALRLALLSAKFAAMLDTLAVVGPTTSVLAQNTAFLKTDDPVLHSDGLDYTTAPWKVEHDRPWSLPGMWQTP